MGTREGKRFLTLILSILSESSYIFDRLSINQTEYQPASKIIIIIIHFVIFFKDKYKVTRETKNTASTPTKQVRAHLYSITAHARTGLIYTVLLRTRAHSVVYPAARSNLICRSSQDIKKNILVDFFVCTVFFIPFPLVGSRPPHRFQACVPVNPLRNIFLYVGRTALLWV
jgi:hypothetical protein